MKTKRALALLLAVMMVMTMLPVQAFAAGAYKLQAIEPTSTEEDQVTFEIKGTTAFGNTVTEENGIETTQDLVDNWSTFTDGLELPNPNKKVDGQTYVQKYAAATTPADKAAAIKDLTDILDGNYEKLNLTGELSDQVTASPDGYVYVAVKFKLGGKTAETAGKTQQKGIYQGAVSVMYDKDVFEYDDSTGPAILNPLEFSSTNWVKGQSYANLAKVGLEDYRASIQHADQSSSIALSSGYSKDISDIGDQLPTSSSDKTNITYTENITNVGAVLLTVQSSGFSGYISKKTEWDVLIPLKVKANAAAGSTSEIGLVPTWKVSGSAAAQLNSIMASTAEGSSANTSTDGTQKAFKYGDEIDNSAGVNMTKLTVTIDGPSIKGPATLGSGATTITVTASKATFTNDAKTASNWTLSGTGANSAKVTKAEVNTEGTEVKLTLDKGVAAGDLTITAAAGVIQDASSNPSTSASTATVTVKAAPTATLTYTTDNNKATTCKLTTTASDPVVWRLKGATSWSTEAIPSGGATVTGLDKIVAEGETIDDAIQLAWKADTTITGAVSVTRSAAPAEPTINYVTGQITIPNTVAYVIDGTANQGSGSPIDVTPGKTITYWSLESLKLPSATKTLTPPAAPTITVKDHSTADEKAAGQSSYTVTTNPTGLDVYYVVKGSSDPAPTQASDFSNKYTSETAINASTAQKVYFMVKGNDGKKNFDSAIANDTGKGVNYSTVKRTSEPTEGGNTVELTLTGPGTWATFSASNFTVTDETGSTSKPITATSGTIADKKITLTLDKSGDFASGFVKGNSYKIVVGTGAVTGNLNGDTSTATTIEFTVANDGVGLSATNENITLTPDFAPAGAATDIAVSGTGMTGKKITGASNAKSNLGSVAVKDESNITYTAEAVTGDAATNSDTITLTLEAYPLTYQNGGVISIEAGKDGTLAMDATALTKLTGVTYTLEGAPTGVSMDASTPSTIKVDGSKFTTETTTPHTFTVKGSNGATATIKLNVTGKQATPDFTAVTKAWDGTTEIDATNLAKVTYKDSDGSSITVSLTNDSKKPTFKTGNAGDDKVVVPDGMKVTDGTLTYVVPAGEYTVTTAITQAAFNKAEVTYSKTKSSMTIEDLAKDLLTQAVKVYGTVGGDAKEDTAEKKTVGALLDTNAQTTLETAIITALKAKLTADGNTDEANAVTDNSYTLKAKLDLDIDVTSNINAPALTNIANVTKIDIAVSLKKPSAAPSGPSASVDTADGLVTPDGEVTVDETGKITSLPKADTVKGATFFGWSTVAGDKNHIVKVGKTLEDGQVLYPVIAPYMSGYTDNTVKPDRDISRAEIASLLVMASGNYDPDKDYGKSEFTDAQSGWYTDIVTCASQAGILNGDGNGYARPAAEVTRYEAAAMLANAFGIKPTGTETTEKFTDMDKLPAWARPFVAILAENGTLNGYKQADGTYKFDGDKTITRGEIASMINMYLGLNTTAKYQQLKSESGVSAAFDDITPDHWAYPHVVFATLNAPASYYSHTYTEPEVQ